MTNWMRRIRGALGMGVTWALGWAATGLMIGVASRLFPFLPWDPFFQVFDAPLPAFGIPGFVAGIFFSLILGVAARGRRLGELSLPRVAAWGAAGGLALAVFPFALVALGLGSREGSSVGDGQLLAFLTVPFVTLSAASAALIVWLAKRSDRVAVREESASHPPSPTSVPSLRPPPPPPPNRVR